MRGALHAESRAAAVLTGLAAVGAAGAGTVVGGTPGLLAGAVLVVTWLLAPPVFVVALGHVLFAAALPAEASLAALALVEAPLVTMVLVDVADRRAPIRTLAVGVASLAAFGALAVAGVFRLATLREVTVLLVAVVALTAYALHRYTVVVFEYTDEF